MKLCTYLTYYFKIKCIKFGYNAFVFHISLVNCVDLIFSGHSVELPLSVLSLKALKFSYIIPVLKFFPWLNINGCIE